MAARRRHKNFESGVQTPTIQLACVENISPSKLYKIHFVSFPEQGEKGMHISHPVHSDNCVLKHEGKNITCVKEFPAYTWRDYR